ncbi:hypothetical protein FACS1894180_3480 [Bacteroidia bacterium]|nr:hypothetical protein FACS1894180_3480 [Bacteroidia bacterium]
MSKMTVTNYEILKSTSMPKGGVKAYDFAEYIGIRGNFFTDFEMTIAAQGEEKEYDNTANFVSTYNVNMYESIHLNFRCDCNNNFNTPVTYLSEYDLNGTIYSNLYIFSEENVQFYVAKYSGIIRMIKTDDFDWILIDKNVKQ